ncbi:MAG: hypothetical protein QOK13_256 [Gaiellaceae bacterium]|nr:hypothetical protein [Gaiellaceae bacterium]MDX6509903.1 hypothetical protein [Gaiellaceae bacterium]
MVDLDGRVAALPKTIRQRLFGQLGPQKLVNLIWQGRIGHCREGNDFSVAGLLRVRQRLEHLVGVQQRIDAP